MHASGISQRRSPNPLDSLTRQTASILITLYQKQISPRKGFSCAHRVLHGSESCSQYTKRIISECGISRALPLIQERFQACKVANQTFKARKLCHSAKQRDNLQLGTLAAIAPPYRQFDRLAVQPWMAIEDEPIELPDENEPDEEQTQQRGRSVGGGNFRKPPVVNNADANNATNQNNCSDWNCDSLDCAYLGCDAIDCASADWSAIDCGAADCSSLDCGSLDCGSCDVGGCDCSF